MTLGGLIAHHQLAVTLAVAFLAGIGLPMPVAVILLAAGAAAHSATLPLAVLLPSVWLASSAGDTVLYLGGRYTGWWLLAWLCRLTTNPEQCIFTSADYFYRRGPKTLLFAKFIPGLGTIAAPLAGSLNMRLWRFLRLDIVGAMLYTSSWILTGYLFSSFIHVIERGIGRAGHFAFVGLLLLVAGYGLSWLRFSIKARRFNGIERVAASDLYERLQTVDPNRLVIIADVRSHGYYDPGMQRIKNSIRVEPHRLKEELLALREFMAPECEIYLYCSCIREATSVRVAYWMEKENCRTQVIDGGLRAWVKAGGEVEPVPEDELQRLPRFD
jgi:membrane protein DedA with SNARE-associated domain/rhodanese-related sulfurtransferase